MPKFKITDIDKALEVQSGNGKLDPSKVRQMPKANSIDYEQIDHNNKKPTLLSDPAGWWAGLTESQKLEAIETLGEFTGGTVGVIAGGGTPASIPGAGAGAVAGKGIARGIGRAAGLKPEPKSVRDELIDTAKTFGMNAGAEGVGAGMALMKPLLKRWLAKVIKADPHVAQLAENAGIQLTPSMVSQRPIVKMTDAFLENTPGGMGTIRKKTNKALSKNESNLRKIPEKFNPTPVDRTEAGTALKDQVAGNRAAIKEEFKPKYGDIIAQAGDAPINAGTFRQSARDFIEELPDKLESYFPSAILKKMKQTAGMMDGKWTADGLVDTGTPELTFREAQQLRTALLEAERAMTTGDTAVQRRAIPALRDALDRSIDESLQGSTNPVHKKALEAWRKTNKEYGEASQQVGRSGNKGNATAESIARAKNPDSVVMSVANSPNAVREAEVATNPMFRATDENAMGKLRRNRADDLIDSSQTQHRWNQNDRIVNPDTLERKLTARDGTEELMAPASLELQDNISLGKAIVGPSKLTNTSNTSRFQEAMRYGTAAGGAVTGAVTGDGDLADRSTNALLGGLAGGVALPYLAAKAWTSPRFANAAINGGSAALKAPVAGPLLGGAARGLMDMQSLPVPQSLEEEERATAKPGTVRFKISDIQ